MLYFFCKPSYFKSCTDLWERKHVSADSEGLFNFTFFTSIGFTICFLPLQIIFPKDTGFSGSRASKLFSARCKEIVSNCEEGQVHVYPILDFLAPEAGRTDESDFQRGDSDSGTFSNMTRMLEVLTSLRAVYLDIFRHRYRWMMMTYSLFFYLLVASRAFA